MAKSLTLPKFESGGKHMSDKEALTLSRAYNCDSFWPDFEKKVYAITEKSKRELDNKLDQLCKTISENLGGLK